MNCFLSSVATDGKDRHGLKCYACKNHPKLVMVSLPGKKFVWYLLHWLHRSILGKGTKQWLQHKIDLKWQYPCGKAPLWFDCLWYLVTKSTVSGENMHLIFCSSALPFPHHPYLYSIPRKAEHLENTHSNPCLS